MFLLPAINDNELKSWAAQLFVRKFDCLHEFHEYFVIHTNILIIRITNLLYYIHHIHTLRFRQPKIRIYLHGITSQTRFFRTCEIEIWHWDCNPVSENSINMGNRPTKIHPSIFSLPGNYPVVSPPGVLGGDYLFRRHFLIA